MDIERIPLKVRTGINNNLTQLLKNFFFLLRMGFILILNIF